MATQEKTWNVANRLHSMKDSDKPEVNHIIAGADEIYDDTKGAKQSDINAQTETALADRYTKAETYSKEQLDSLITTPDANYVTVATFADLPQTGEANTIYRVSSYDGTQVDASKYALYAWNGTAYQLLAVRSAVGEVFDVSEYNSGATYETLAAALAAVPASVQKGGMSIKFILRTNTGTEEEPVYHDEYVLYRLMNTDWSTVAGDWQGVDSELIAGSRNLVESGVVHNELALGAVYDVSAKNPTAGPNNDGKFESLSALLSDANLNTLIPTAYRKGGMSIKFVQSSDNKYVQYRLMVDTFSTTPSDWQGVDDEPTAESQNLVKSGGVEKELYKINQNIIEFPYERVDGYYLNTDGNRVVRASSSYFVYTIPNVLKTIRLKGTAVGVFTSSIVFTAVNDFSEECLSKYTFNGNIDEVLEVPKGTKYILVDKFNDSEMLNLLEPVYELPVILNIEADFTIDGFINGEGVYRDTGVFKSTDYIPIYSGYLIEGKVYKVVNEGDDYNTESYVVFFNKEKEIIELIKSETTGLSDFSVVAPSEAYFVKLSTKTSGLSNSYAEIISNLGSITNEVHKVDDITSSLESTQAITYSEGGYIDTDGIIHEAAATSWAHTGYLRINPNDLVNASAAGAPGTTLLVAFYDSNREFIQGVAPTLNQQIENVRAIAPANSVYVVVGSRIASISPAPSGNLIKRNYVSQQDLQNTEERLQDSIDDVYDDISDDINLYHNNLHKPFIFTNKTAAFFGDSVTHGVSSDAGGVHNPSEDWDILDCYRKVLCKKANLIGTTYAVSGSFICDLENAQSSILNMVKNNISANSNYDFIFIAGGINDFWTRKPLGQLGDSSYNTFYGALENMCDHLDSVLVGKTTEVIFLTPINYSHTRDIGAGESLNTYRNAIFEIATMHGYNVIDTSVIGFPNKKTLNLYKQTMIYDGVHPTVTGHKMMGENLYSILL